MIELIIITIIVAFMATWYKVEEAKTKGLLRKELKNAEFAFLSTKGWMAFSVSALLSPILWWVDWSLKLLLIVTLLSVGRFAFWVLVNRARGKYSSTEHQASSNFTMLENFAGPLGALFVYGIYGAITNSNVPMFWYFMSPFIGIFLLWALREQGASINKEMLAIIGWQASLVSVETGILIYVKMMSIEVNLPSIISFIDGEYAFFMLIIGVSSLFSGLFFFKDIIHDWKIGAGKKGMKIGLMSGFHDIIYFGGFAFFGPIFIIGRRGLLVPIQNLYLGIKEGRNLKELFMAPIKVPLLSLKGGKDFIISFTDLVFNRTVKVIINLSS